MKNKKEFIWCDGQVKQLVVGYGFTVTEECERVSIIGANWFHNGNPMELDEDDVWSLVEGFTIVDYVEGPTGGRSFFVGSGFVMNESKAMVYPTLEAARLAFKASDFTYPGKGRFNGQSIRVRGDSDTIMPQG